MPSTRLARLGVVAFVAALSSTALRGTAPAAPTVRCGHPGEWPHTADAAWTARVITAGGFAMIGCTGSALVIDTGGRGRSGHDLYVWTSRSKMIPRYGSRASTIAGVAIHYDRLRAVWRVGARNVWVEAGPTTRWLLPLERLRRLIRASTTTG